MLLTALPLLLANSPQGVALAQSFDDLDGDSSSARSRNRGGKPEVKEIVRGFYAKSNVGGSVFLGDFSGFVDAGTSVGLTVGQDFMDGANSSAAWELGLYQGIYNGMNYEAQQAAGCQAFGGAAPCTQGDMRTYTILASFEYSLYLSRRIGIGLRAGGGMLFSPLLMDEYYYETEVLPYWGFAEGTDPGYHGVPHPIFGGGPTFEYYSKLSHFSVGVDTDVLYGVNFDLGVNATGYLKYTF